MATAWHQLASSLVTNAVVGSVFAFGKLSSSFAERLGCSEAQAAVIGLCGDVGLWLSVVPGAYRDRQGDGAALATGVCLAVLGYGATCWLLVRRAHYALVAASWAVCGHANAWLYATMLVSTVTTWHPSARGAILGCLQAFFGLSGAVCVEIYTTFFGGRQPARFVATLGIATAGAGLWGLWNRHTTKILHRLDAVGQMRLRDVSILVAGLLCVLISSSLLDVPSVGAYAGLAALALIHPLLLRGTPTEIAGDGPTSVDSNDHVAVFFGRFWLLWLAFGVAVGGAVTTSNVTSAIAQSTRRCSFQTLASRAATLLASLDAATRVASGAALDRVGGAAILGFANASLAIAHLVFLLAPPAATWRVLVGGAFAGATNGAAWTACPYLVACDFGTARYGDNFGLACTAAMVFVVAYSYGVLPVDYDNDFPTLDCQVDDDDSPDVCYGKACFADLHRAILASSVAGVLASVGLAHRRPTVATDYDLLPDPQPA